MKRALTLVGPFFLVVASVVAVLGLVDRVPSRITATPYGALAYRTLEAAERDLGFRLWLPAYYPSDLTWPPSRVYSVTGPPATAVIEVAAAAGERDRLTIWQSPETSRPPAPRVFEPGQELTTNEVVLGRHRAQLAHRFLAGGREVRDLWWNQSGRRITLRYAGPVNQLILMAASMERVHP